MLSLFVERNYMKIYEKDFGSAFFSQTINDHWRYDANAEYAYRRTLESLVTESPSKFRIVTRDYTSNTPFNYYSDNPVANHTSALLAGTAYFRPWVRYQVKNGNKNRYKEEEEPEFSIGFRQGLPSIDFGLGRSSTSFSQINLGFAHQANLNNNIQLIWLVKTGVFLYADKIYLQDYHHFDGNLIPFIPSNGVASFRLLSYYAYSVPKRYAELHSVLQLRRFGLTRLPFVRAFGIKEILILNTLQAPSQANYSEIGYGIDGIARLFRVEAVANFRDGKYQTWNILFGLTLKLGGGAKVKTNDENDSINISIGN
jgi:hypothetical protein